jgi:hypothetical protein
MKPSPLPPKFCRRTRRWETIAGCDEFFSCSREEDHARQFNGLLVEIPCAMDQTRDGNDALRCFSHRNVGGDGEDVVVVVVEESGVRWRR